ncbi:LysR family transcriptional regulator substrate-binding protein [Streptomyces sp. NPDC056255]|uniref:LysR family transcriptional regulator substrate-binding protein n=1 Tax=Streptomyces sp. NPDC056255 TaxID=3345764 RepID=UPI0035D8097B
MRQADQQPDLPFGFAAREPSTGGRGWWSRLATPSSGLPVRWPATSGGPGRSRPSRTSSHPPESGEAPGTCARRPVLQPERRRAVRVGPASEPGRRRAGCHPETTLDVVTLSIENAAQVTHAVLDGTVDASFRALPAGQVPAGISAERLVDEPLELLVGPGHPLADAPWGRPADLAGHRIWIPGIMPGTEWAAFHQALSEAFGLNIDALGPNFGDEALMDALADSASLATLVGSGDRYVWPQATTCGASRCTNRPRCTRTCCFPAPETSTPC